VIAKEGNVNPSVEDRPGRRNIVALGVVSFLTDISSEMTLTLLPLFLADTLGTKVAIIGLIEGIAESTATLLKLVSGWISDRLRRRKALAVLGYGLSAFSKPFLYLANAWGPVLGIRFADRVGKGLRTAPRDALVADSAGENGQGRAFGLHRALDTAGAVWGTGIAAIVIFLSQQGAEILNRATYQRLVLVGIVPGLLAVLVLLLLVREARPRASTASLPRLSLRGYDRRFYIFLAAVVLFTLGNSSDAFLLLRARNLGLSAVQVALMVFAFNGLYSLLSMPLGALSDRVGRRRVILLGWGIYGLIYLGFALARVGWQVALLYILYGLYYAAFEGTSRALVADTVPDSARRGTAYGLYHFAVGVTAVPASLLAGLLWQTIAPAAPFYFGAFLVLLAALLFAFGVRPVRQE
jgi:MFS family permease